MLDMLWMVDTWIANVTLMIKGLSQPGKNDIKECTCYDFDMVTVEFFIYGFNLKGMLRSKLLKFEFIYPYSDILMICQAITDHAPLSINIPAKIADMYTNPIRKNPRHV